MKKISVFLTVILVLGIGASLQQVNAQETTKAEQEKEARLLQQIEEQKRTMAEQKKAQAESEFIFQERQAAMEDMMKDVQVQIESSGRPGNSVRLYSPRGGRTIALDDFAGSGQDAYFIHGIGSDTERTTWDFSKSVKENSFSRDYTFDVEKTVRNVVMSINGDCKSGDIRIRILMPNGKSYSDIVIDEFGNLNWRKSFAISETENQDKTGEWKFQISSNKATGFFRISLQAY